MNMGKKNKLKKPVKITKKAEKKASKKIKAHSKRTSKKKHPRRQIRAHNHAKRSRGFFFGLFGGGSSKPAKKVRHISREERAKIRMAKLKKLQMKKLQRLREIKRRKEEKLMRIKQRKMKKIKIRQLRIKKIEEAKENRVKQKQLKLKKIEDEKKQKIALKRQLKLKKLKEIRIRKLKLLKLKKMIKLKRIREIKLRKKAEAKQKEEAREAARKEKDIAREKAKKEAAAQKLAQKSAKKNRGFFSFLFGGGSSKPVQKHPGKHKIHIKHVRHAHAGLHKHPEHHEHAEHHKHSEHHERRKPREEVHKSKITPKTKKTEKIIGEALEAIKIKKIRAKEEKFKFINTDIPGLNALLKEGIPEGASVLVEGGPGSGKTIFCLSLVKEMCRQGKKVLYMSFEEPEYRLRAHLNSFGTDVVKYEREKKLYIKRFNALDIARSVEALLSEAKKELLIDVQPVLIPHDFEPDIVLIDSLTSIGSAFSGEESRFRIYMEQLFRYLESHQITSFLIRETSNPTHIGTTFIEKAEAVSFLSDGIIALYNVFLPNGARKRAIEIIKMRGVQIERKVVECDIIQGKGVIVYPNKPLEGKYTLT